MCGICGHYDPAGVAAGSVSPMLHALAHRGPDDEGLYVNGRIALGARRLSIIDLPGGRQPIANEDETIWIVFNGEIYNYRTLRHELEQRGHIFRTQTDTEVIVHLYEEVGERCVDRLRGMFAFALWDSRSDRLVLVRDRLGQKPLFYARDGDRLLFASEMKAILAVSRQPRTIDYEAIHHYLSLRFIPPPRTMLQHVKKLAAGHLLIWQQGEITIRPYWDVSFREKLHLSEAEFLDGLRHKLVETIQAHLVSDVPVGAFLSGGMDSSMIVAVMAQELGLNPQTFAIGVVEQSFDELPYARAVAEHHRTRHVEECVSSDLMGSLPEMIWHLDEPSDPVAACQFYAAGLAARHVKVALGGDGGDELFAGFDRYMGVSYIRYYAAVPELVRRRVTGPLLGLLPDSFAYKNLTQQLRWVHELAQLPDMARRYAAATSFFRFNHAGKQALYAPDLWTQFGRLDSADVIAEHFNHAPADNLLDRMLYADYKTRLPEHSLMLNDRMTMAHGLELRSPFLDHELVEYLAAFPAHLKIRGRQLKYLLRRLANRYLPPTIVNRSKQGFTFPVAFWFRHEWFGKVRDALRDAYFVRDGLFRYSYIEQMLDEHRRNQDDHHVRLWLLLNLEIWHQLYIEQAAPSALGTALAAAEVGD